MSNVAEELAEGGEPQTFVEESVSSRQRTLVIVLAQVFALAVIAAVVYAVRTKCGVSEPADG